MHIRLNFRSREYSGAVAGLHTMENTVSFQAAGNLDIGAAAAEVADQVRLSVVEVRAHGGGAGAGTIWRQDGVIVTNHHVVSRDRAEVGLADGRTLAARVVRRDPRNDLATLQVDAANLPAARIGDARALRPGELVLAVGHPFGVRGSVSVGVVSVAPRGNGPTRERELVHADVLLGPGNSGGPLVDAFGRVVGINAMINGGMALAIPSHLAQRLVVGQSERPTLGIGVQDVTLAPAQAARVPFDLQTPAQTARGPFDPQAAARDPFDVRAAVMVIDVHPASAAERAGLLLGDILLALDGQPLPGSDGLLEALAMHPGGAIRLSILRGGEPREIVVLPALSERRAA